jgi:hypothetical protein
MMVMLATIQSRTFCLLICCLETLITRIWKAKILSVLPYGCETWSLILREEHRLRIFENRVLRRMFEPKRFEVTRGWRGLHNEELYSLYSSPSTIRLIKSRAMIWAGNASRMGKTPHIGYWRERQKERHHHETKTNVDGPWRDRME